MALNDDRGISLETYVSSPAGYVFPEVPGPGPWRLTAKLHGFERHSIEQVKLQPGMDNQLHLRLNLDPNGLRDDVIMVIDGDSPGRFPPHELVGTVTTADGLPVNGAMVTIRHASQRGRVDRCQSDDRGRYVFRVPESGPWRLTIEAPRLATFVRENVQLVPRERLTVNIALNARR